MIAKITLENFMAHELTELELGPGVNALTGPNNTGKSAIVEALRCVATNPVPRHYIRHGAKEARVSLEFEDGTRVVWVRRKRSSGYELWHPGSEEPEEYWKFGRKPPEDILNVLKLDLVELETGSEIDVHVGNQREPVFLLNQPGSNAAAFFAASTESAHLLAMQNLLKRRTLDAKRKERYLHERLTGIEEDLNQFSPLPDIGVALDSARELDTTAKGLQQVIPALESLLDHRGKVEDALVSKKMTTTILKQTNKVPELKETKILSVIVGKITALEKAEKKASSSENILKLLKAFPEVYDTGRMAAICKELQQLEKRADKAREMQLVSTELAAPPSMEKVIHLSQIIDEILVHRTRFDREQRRHSVLQAVAEPPAPTSDEHLASLLVGIRSLEEESREREAALNDLEMRLGSVKDGIVQQIEALGCCPTCGADIDSAAFLDRRCRHDA
ncbi:AAA family ATPase [Pseudodesulfovibrio sp.]|nr:AAA family ATPase [Pseudodesulfovibrio sp.]